MRKSVGGVCGIHLFVEFDLDVAPTQFLIIDSYLDCIDMPVNTKNHASRRSPVLKNVVNRRQFPHSGSSTQSLITKETETAEILRSITIEKNYKNFYILKSELQASEKISRAAAVITNIKKENKKIIKNIGDNEKKIYKIKKIEEKIYENEKIEKKIREIKNKFEIKNLNLKKISDVKYEFYFKIIISKIEI
jgi:hypothetical protein